MADGTPTKEMMESYFRFITARCCKSTVSGWLWYCDEHDVHGNASSEDEAVFVSNAHIVHMEDGDSAECHIWYAEAIPPEVAK